MALAGLDLVVCRDIVSAEGQEELANSAALGCCGGRREVEQVQLNGSRPDAADVNAIEKSPNTWPCPFSDADVVCLLFHRQRGWKDV